MIVIVIKMNTKNKIFVINAKIIVNSASLKIVVINVWNNYINFLMVNACKIAQKITTEIKKLCNVIKPLLQIQ